MLDVTAVNANPLVDAVLPDGVVVVNPVVLTVKSENNAAAVLGEIDNVHTMLVFVRITGLVHVIVDDEVELVNNVYVVGDPVTLEPPIKTLIV